MEKSVTVKSAFKEIFGNALEPFGFVKAKLSQSYYIRMAGDDILHIIGIHDMKTHILGFGAVATVYREDLCLDRTFRQNESWLKSTMYFYVRWHASDQEFDPQIQFGFHYRNIFQPQSIPEAVQHALDAAVTWILPVLDKIQTPKDVLDFYRNTGAVLSLPLSECGVAAFSDTAIQFLLPDPLADLEERRTATLKAVAEEDERYQRAPEVIAKNRADYEKRLNESRSRLHRFLEDADIRRQTLKELARRKTHNTELLRKYGIC